MPKKGRISGASPAGRITPDAPRSLVGAGLAWRAQVPRQGTVQDQKIAKEYRHVERVLAETGRFP